MEEKKIPFLLYEAEMTKVEMMIRKFWVMCLVLLGVLVGSNLCWIIHFFGLVGI